jgi:hypothetical protein
MPGQNGTTAPAFQGRSAAEVAALLACFDDVVALGRPLPVTEFRGTAAAAKRERTTTLRDLAPLIRVRTGPAKDALPWIKLARFGDRRSDKGSLRHDANVLEIEGVEADYDAGRMALEEA